MPIAKKLINFILLLIACAQVSAQDFELIKFQTAYYPKQNIDDSSVNGKIAFWEWSGQAIIPQPLKNRKTIFLHQLKYSNLRVEIDGSFNNNSFENKKDYHTITYGLSLVQTLKKDWLLLVSFIPTIASDLTGSLGGEDFLYLASVTAMKTQSTQFKYGFGVAYTTSFGRQLVIPTGMIKYTKGRTTFDVMLPSKLSVLFNSGKVFNYGLQAKLDGGVFSNSSDIDIVNEEIDGTGYSRMNLGPVLSLKLKEMIKINFEGGVAVARRLDFINNSDENIERTPENGPFFRVGVSLTPKIKG